jgi:hypothetical protein
MSWFSASQCRPVRGTVTVVPARARLTAARAGLHLDPACAPAFHGSYEEPGTTKISLTEVSTLPGLRREALLFREEVRGLLRWPVAAGR